MNEMSRPLILKEFKDWLEQQPDDRQLYKIQGPKACGCPIALYFKDNGKHNPLIGDYSFLVDEIEYKTPIWAQNFIYIVDSISPQKVNKKTCLKILEGILK